MNFVLRIKEILLDPKGTWPVIEAEATDATTVYTQYVMLLALVPTISVFIGNAVAHTGQFSFFGGIVRMVVDYVLWLAMIYLVALLADRMAPNFHGQRNPIAALKLIAYSATAGMLGGIFSAFPIPSLYGIPGLLAWAYSRALGGSAGRGARSAALALQRVCPGDGRTPEHHRARARCGFVRRLL